MKKILLVLGMGVIAACGRIDLPKSNFVDTPSVEASGEEMAPEWEVLEGGDTIRNGDGKPEALRGPWLNPNPYLDFLETLKPSDREKIEEFQFKTRFQHPV